MSGIEQQKNINFGAKLTGKIAGGIYFVGGTQVTPITQNTWTGIGDAVGPGQFILMPIQPVSAPVSTGVTAINDYFELEQTGALTSTQRLWYRYGKRAVHYCSYALTLHDATAMGALALTFQARVVSFDHATVPVTTVIAQSVRTFTVFSTDASPVSHTFPLVVPAGESFAIQIQNLDSDRDITVDEAFLSIYE